MINDFELAMIQFKAELAEDIASFVTATRRDFEANPENYEGVTAQDMMIWFAEGL